MRGHHNHGAQAASVIGQPPLLVTVSEAARLLALGRTSIYQLMWADELRPVRIGKSVRFTIAELERFVAERELDPPSG